MNDSFLDNLYTLPMLSRITISPDGKYIAFTWRHIHPNIDVFYVPTDGSNEPIALTKTSETTSCKAFYPKSKALLVSEDRNGNEHYQLFRVNLDEPRKLFPLTRENPSYFLRGGCIHPNERWLIYGANYSFDDEKEIEPTHVFRHDLLTEEIICLARPTKATWLVPKLSKDGKHILYNRKEFHPKGHQIWLVDIEGKGDQEILNFGSEARVKADWLLDSTRILFKTDMENGTMQRHYSIGIYDISSEEIIWLIDDPSRNVEDFYVPILGNNIIIKEYEKARTKSSIIDLSTLQEFFLPRIQGNLIPFIPFKNRIWIGVFYSSTQPADIIQFDLDDIKIENFRSLTNVWTRTAIRRKDLTQAEDFEWQSEDGLTIHGWLYQPQKSNGRAIVFVHGGPTMHSVDYITIMIQYLTYRGFTVLDPNYRGSTGYGIEFEDAIRKNGWGSDEQVDIWTGIKAMIAKGLAQKGKVGITGTSYGGYSSWLAITKAPIELVAAAAPICGMTDLVLDYELTRPDIRRSAEQMLGGSPSEVPEVYFDRSPINFIQNIKGKLFIIQGAQDPNVTLENVIAVKDKLKEFNIEYKEFIFEDEGHGIIRVKNQKFLYKLLADFFEESL